MNFFKEQERVRKRTNSLLLAFYSIVILTSFATAGFLFLVTEYREEDFYNNIHFYETSFFWAISSGVFLYISLMSFIRVQNLKEGPATIAAMAGAKPVPANTTDITYKRLTNIVEEISIAAGIIPPRVYIMPEEQDINAFAAGFTIHDAIIAVSQGCLNKLTREELQAVVAHEIGHIVSGDMKLNLELIGKLYGLMSIHEAGIEIMRPRRRSSSSTSLSKNKDGSGAFLFGVILFVVGFVGHFVALLLKLAISRGQEFNADAKSVQFTRNPQGLAGALKKILAYKNTFKINATKKNQLSHLYFHYPSSFNDMFATHPPLEIRIKKIDPSFRPANFIKNEITGLKTMMETNISMLVEKSFSQGPAPTPNYILENENDYYDQTLAFFYLISGATKGRDAGGINYYFDKLKTLSPDELLREMDLILGRLRAVNELEVRSILKKVKEVILEDKQILPSETLCFTLFKEVLLPSKKHLSSKVGLNKAKTDITIIMSYLATISSETPEGAQESFKIGMQEVYTRGNFEFVPKSSLSDLNNAFERLKDIIPLGREKVYKAAHKAMITDQRKSFNEAVFLKVLGQIMAIPTKDD